MIDIGSNSVRLVVYHLFGSAFFPTYNEKALAGLGRSLRETGRLSEDGKRETLEALRRFAHIVRARDLSPVLIGATAAMRDAEDSGAFRDQVLEATGFDITAIPGEEEARLAALGVLAGDRRASGLACDLGGASLEIVPIRHGQQSGEGVSMRLGPFQVVGDDLRAEFDPAVQRPIVAEAIAGIGGERRTTLHLIGGAWRNLALIHQEKTGYPLRVLQGYRIGAQELLPFLSWAYGAGRDEVLEWPGISSRRRETLPYGALVLEEMLTRFQPEEVRISATGLREGLVVDYMGDLRTTRTPLVDGCRDIARGNLQAEGLARPLGRFLAPIDDHLPRAFEAGNEARLREAARHLAGMGRGLHPDYRAELVFENVLYAPLSGLTHAERAYLAHILHASYTSSKATSNEAAMDRLLSPEQRRAARAYGAAIRLGEAVSGRAVDLLSKLELVWDGVEVQLSALPGYEDLLGGRAVGRLSRLNSTLSRDTTSQDSEDEDDGAS